MSELELEAELEGLADDQREAVLELRDVLSAFAAALTACDEAGLPPATALEHAGVRIPGWAKPLVSRMLTT